MQAHCKDIKSRYPGAKTVFIGPCVAKKDEAEHYEGIVDAVLTFEELQALYDSRNIDITALSEDVLDNASYYGRIFARSGGLTDAVAQAVTFTAQTFVDALKAEGAFTKEKQLLKSARYVRFRLPSSRSRKRK